MSRADSSPGEDAAATPWEEVERLRRETARLQEELERQRGNAAGFFERLEALQAEFEEYRSQVHREHSTLREDARKDLLVRMLDVTDSLDHAIDFAGGDEALHDGLVAILRQLRAILDREGVQRIEAEGHLADPLKHDIVMREVTSEYRNGTIVKEMAKGYTLRGEVIRKAKVKVAVNRPPA